MKIDVFYSEVRANTETICKPLTSEEYVVQIAVFASPAKWHLAHTTWFFETFILNKYQPNYQVFNSTFGFLFNSYYNHAGPRIRRENRGNIIKPETQEIYDYRAYVDEAMRQLLATNTDETLIKETLLGLHHEQQHQELLWTDIKYMLGNNPLFPVYDKETNELKDHKDENSAFISIPGGIYEIGHQGHDFCYDNEQECHKVHLNDFKITTGLVRNQAYLDFINDGAYSDFNLWLDEGWSWVQTHKIQAPLYWHKREGEWHQYTLAGLQKIDPEAILQHVNFYEAAAFAEWSGMRLPTEFEWEAAADNLPWGKRWEWTNSAYLPYPGYKKAQGAIGEYNGKFMVNQMVLRGSSLYTPAEHSRKTYRNFFHPHENWQYTGIRLTK